MGASTSVVAQSVAFSTFLVLRFLTQTPRSSNHTHEAILKREKLERCVRRIRERKEAAGGGESKKLPRLTEEEHRLRREQGLYRLEEKSKAGLAKQREDAVRKLEEQEALTRKQQEEAARQQEEAARQQEEAARQQEEAARQQAELELQYLLRARGIEPEVWPTPEERDQAEALLHQPRDEHFHCAIAGFAGSGKSSLINAFRGLQTFRDSSDTAPAGVTETTLVITAYPDPSPTPPQSRFVWYDIPGAGTITIPGWQYFNNQGLFIFDLIIVVVDNRFTEQDLLILKHCERYKIPSFLVRSKANQHIENIMQEDGWAESDDERDFNEVYQPARERLVSETSASYRKNLEAGGLDPEKEVFIVSRNGLAALVSGEEKKLRKKNQLIHEAKLVLNCLEAVQAMRY